VTVTDPLPSGVVEVLDHQFRAMGTWVHVVLVGGTDEQAREVEHAVHAAELLLSRFLDDSDLGRLARAGGRPVAVEPLTRAVLRRALIARKDTDGAFDPTLGRALARAGYDRPFSELAGFPSGARALEPPDPTAADRISIDDDAGTITLPDGVALDFGGIAKGYLADELAARLVSRGLLGVCVNLGGDLRAAGLGPDLGGWTVALDHHLGHQEVVELSGGGLATSTDRRRRWAGPDGSVRHHLLDPTTGAPATGDTASVTVVAPDATTAETLSKVAFVRPDRFAALLGPAGASALLSTTDGRVRTVGAWPGGGRS
jgi:FAD:protein FMN transferase